LEYILKNTEYVQCFKEFAKKSNEKFDAAGVCIYEIRNSVGKIVGEEGKPMTEGSER
jgi:hypothetical protein